MAEREGREVELEGGIEGRGDAGGAGMPEAAEGEETGDGGLEKGIVEAEADNTGALGGGTRGRELRQFPESPGRQREQRVPLLAQEHHYSGTNGWRQRPNGWRQRPRGWR